MQDLREQVEIVVGMEARGFLFGPTIAQALGAGFVPVRKPGKLPAATLSQDYGLEYGTDTLQIHADAVAKGQRVLIVDDLLATGGTASATCSLIEAAGGRVLGCLFLIELGFLPGREALGETRCDSVIVY